MKGSAVCVSIVGGSGRFGGAAVRGFALLGFIPTLGGAALALLLPDGLSPARPGRGTKGRSLRGIEASA